MWTKLLLLAVAGAAGTLCRYGLTGLVQRSVGSEFPWGTFAVNAAGCLVVGMLWALFENRLSITPQARLVILVGFMGAFTTFSAFVLETGELLHDSQWLWAAGNVLLQNVVGLVAFFGGVAAGRFV